MQGRKDLEVTMGKCQKLAGSKKLELTSMQTGKTTFKSFFKSQKTITKDIDAYEAAISQLEVDITNYDQLIKFITIYHGQVMIDKFKRIKQTAYYRLLKTMSTREISNSHHHATLAHSILTL